MYNLGISLLVLIAVTALLMAVFGLPFWIASLVGMVAFTVCYILIMRHVLKKVGTLMEISQRDLQAARTEKAVKTLESGFKYSKWQFYVGPQINSQIGTIYYLKRDFSTAFDYLSKGFARHWIAMGMLGICYMKRNKSGKMIDTFEKATAANKKEAIIWNLYAYCLDHIGDREKAITIMKRGLKKTKGDERLQTNLEALEEGRKMKMRIYGDLWLQFHLEKPGTLVRQQTKAIQGRRKIARR